MTNPLALTLDVLGETFRSLTLFGSKRILWMSTYKVSAIRISLSQTQRASALKYQNNE
jgi:hypothetical protein